MMFAMELPARAGSRRRLLPAQGAFRPRALPLLLALGFAGGASAQAVLPGAGQLQRQVEESLQPPPPASAPPQAPAAAAVDRSGPALTVRKFVIEGATLIPAEDLAQRLEPWRDRPASLGELQAAAQGLVAAYRERGWFARVQIPPQDASSGTLRIRVIEGRFGRIVTDAAGAARTDAAAIERLVGHRLRAGEPYAQEALERGLLLANDLPGVEADGVLQAGAAVGTSDLALHVRDLPLVSGQVGANNAGSRSTGREQASAQLSLEGPSGRGDQATLALLASDGVRYAGVGYGLPLGSDGLRAHAGATDLRYELRGSFAALDARGRARTATAGLSYPAVRSTALNVWLGLDAARGEYHDDVLGLPLRERRVDTLAASAWGNAIDGLGGGGRTEWRAGLVPGDVHLGVDAPQDAAGPGTEGGFTRVVAEVRRDQALAGAVYLRARFTGQWASGNLDASQKFGLGGPWGVRAFPVDDGLGDSGALVQLELHRPFPTSAAGQFDAFVFADGGTVRQHQQPWAGWDTGGSGRNSYGLAAAGLGLSWSGRNGLTATLLVATPLGGNPGSAVPGHDQDGGRTGTHTWFTAGWRF